MTTPTTSVSIGLHLWQEFFSVALCLCGSLLLSGCVRGPSIPAARHVDVAPVTQPVGEGMALDASLIKPMYREILPIDLDGVVMVARAQNLDIRQARARVEISRGQVETAVGNVFPVVVPSALFEGLEGSNRAVDGKLVGVNFNSLAVSAAVQWALNPGKVVYDIAAAKKRLAATEYQERAVGIETIRAATVQYYDLALAQKRVATAQQATGEADELLRITRARLKSGNGLAADEKRAAAQLASRQQELIKAITAFYQQSITLAVTLHMDSAVTLVPDVKEIGQVALVREELTLDELLGLAVENRPDLAAARELMKAAGAERKAVVWGAVGPNAQLGYQVSGLRTQVDGTDYGPSHQHRATAGVGWTLGLGSIGQYKSASAVAESVKIEAEAQLDRARAQVARALEESHANAKLVPIAREQVEASEEALRLTQANLKAGTMTTLDVLTAQNSVAEARLKAAEPIVRYNQAQVNLVAAMGVMGK